MASPSSLAAPRTVLTTGANSGIGLATAIELARRGFHSVGSVRPEAKAEIVAEAAAGAGVEVDTILLDVADAEQCQRAVAGLNLYGLVNNAGYALNGAVEDVDDDEARALFETMVFAPMRLARLALPGMRAQGGGRIVNISSIAGLTSVPLAGWYSGVKHALEAVSDALRMEVANAGVKVVLVEPGGFKTGIWDGAEHDAARREGSSYTTAYERSRSVVGMGQRFMGEPAQVAKVVAGAIESSRPRARYLVGLDAQAMRLAWRFSPTELRDRVTRLTLGL